MSSNYRNWFFTKAVKQYADVSDLFAGLGTVLIEGDALLTKLFEPQIPLEINHLIKEATDEQIEIYRYKLEKFISKLTKSGLDTISIFFLHCFSTYTVNDNNNNMHLLNNLEKIMKNIKYNLFLSFGDTWSDFISKNHISFIMTSHLDIYISPDDHFTFIYDTCKKKSIQVCLIDDLEFRNLGVYSFLVFSGKDERERSLKSNQETKKIATTSNSQHKFAFDLYKLENKELNELFSDVDFDKTNLLELKKTFKFDYSNDVWETKVEVKFKHERKHEKSFKELKKEESRDAQMYYRYMERYSLSLNSLKSLHHKIVTQTQKGKQDAEVKWSQSALKQLEQIKRSKLKKDEEKEMEVFQTLEASVKTVEELETKMKSMDISEFGAKFKYSILNLKVKFFKNETKTEQTKAVLYMLIKEVIEDYCKYLSADELRAYLDLLKTMGFESTASYFKSYISNDHIILARSASLDKLEFLDTARNDILFQLTHLGDKLKRTLNSKPDKRVRFEPDDWQKELLDAVDNKQSALVCCPTSGGKTLKKLKNLL